MALKQQITDDIKTAMKAREEIRLATLRMLQSAVKYREIELRPGEINDEEINSIIKKLIKQRKDSFEQFTAGNRPELAERESKEIEVLLTYLPAQLDEKQIEAVVVKTIADLGAKSPKEMGAVMKEVLVRLSGAADGKLVSQIVKNKLQ